MLTLLLLSSPEAEDEEVNSVGATRKCCNFCYLASLFTTSEVDLMLFGKNACVLLFDNCVVVGSGTWHKDSNKYEMCAYAVGKRRLKLR